MVSSGQVVFRRRWRIRDGVDVALETKVLAAFFLLLSSLVLLVEFFSLYSTVSGTVYSTKCSLSVLCATDYSGILMSVATWMFRRNFQNREFFPTSDSKGDCHGQVERMIFPSPRRVRRGKFFFLSFWNFFLVPMTCSGTLLPW